jgi:uncharacterized protein (TIGR00255 family)
MITSMTGFGSAVRENEIASVSVAVRSVNHRYLDVVVRLPPAVAGVEPAVRAVVQRAVSRGRVEVSIAVQPRGQAVRVELNEPLVRAVGEAVARARDIGLVAGALTPGDVLRLPDAMRIVTEDGAATTPPAVAALVEEAVAAAVADLGAMRIREGAMLQADLEARRAALGQALERLARAAEAGQAALEARLARRVQELHAEAAVDPALVAQEIVRFAARSDISEEIVRFRAHLDHWGHLAAAPEPCGRKLDFLLQELHREINTIGSKAEGADVPALVVQVKAELEKVREQVQNVE